MKCFVLNIYVYSVCLFFDLSFNICALLLLLLFLLINSVVTFLQIGCNAVSWAPAVVPGSLIDQPSGQKPNYVKRFVSGGCDNLVKLWKYVIVQ